MTIRRCLFSLFFQIVFTICSPATTLYTHRSEWEATVSNIVQIGFEDLAAEASFEAYPDGLMIDGVLFAAAGGDLFVADDEYDSLYDWDSGAVLTTQNQIPSLLVVTLPRGFTAFGADLMTIQPYGLAFTVALSTGETFQVGTSDYPTRAFAGFISDIPITSLSLAVADGPFQVMDNVAFGSSIASIPESGTNLLIAIGVITLVAFKGAGPFRRCVMGIVGGDDFVSAASLGVNGRAVLVCRAAKRCGVKLP